MQSNLNLIPKRKPVTLITGFLGAGKTTLLKRLLSENHGEKIAVIINEFGELGIDDKLIVEENSGIIELTNGCICCTMKNETAKALIQLSEKTESFSRVVIETTGLANPLPILKTFLSEQYIQENYILDGVITLVDAKHIGDQLEKNIETKEQIAYADLVLINKIDLAGSENLEKTTQWIRAINPNAKIEKTKHSDIEIEKIVNLSSLEKLEIPKKTETHIEDSQIQSLVLESNRPLSRAKLQNWLNETVLLYSTDLLRYKGILNIKDNHERSILQGVQSTFELKDDRPWKDGEEKSTKIVFIGKNLDKDILEQSFLSTLA